MGFFQRFVDRRCAAVILALATLAGLLVMVGRSEPASAASVKTGRLNLRVEGLPRKAQPTISLKGPSVTMSVLGGATFKAVTPGRYTARGRAFYTATAKYVPVGPATVNVAAKATSTLTMKYRVVSRTGTLTVAITAPAGGKAPEVTLRGPKKFVRRITATKTFRDLAPGEYSIVGAEISRDGLVFVPGITDPSPTVRPGEKARVDVSWDTARDEDLVVLQSENVVGVPRLEGENPSITVADASGIAVGDPIIVPATDTTPQTVVRAVSVSGQQIGIAEASIFDALPVVDYVFEETGLVAGDVADEAVTTSAKKPRWLEVFDLSCEGMKSVSLERDLKEIFGKITPFINVKSAQLKWDLTSMELFTGPEKAEFVIEAGLTREVMHDLGVSDSLRCAATIDAPPLRLPTIAGIPLWLRGELGAEVVFTSTPIHDAKVKSVTTVSVDMGAKFANGRLSPVFKPKLAVGIEGSPIESWIGNGTVTAEAGFFGSLALSPFDKPKTIDKWGLKGEADLTFGLATRLGYGIGAKFDPPSAAAPSVAVLRIRPYFYSQTDVTFAAVAKASLDTFWGKIQKGFEISESLNLYDRNSPFGPEVVARFGAKTQATSTTVKGSPKTTVPKGSPKTTIPKGSPKTTVPKNPPTTTLPSGGPGATPANPATTTAPSTTTPATPLPEGCSSDLAIGGDVVCAPALARGESVSYNFDATSGDKLRLGGYSALDTLNGYSDVVRIYRPDGTEYALDRFWLDPFLGITVDVGQSGRWRVVYTNSSAQASSGDIRLQLSRVTSQAITPGGATVSSPALGMGGVASYTFSATSGQRFTVGAFKAGYSLGVYDYVRVYRPNGSLFESDDFGLSAYGRVDFTADTTGTWRIDFVNHEGRSASWGEPAADFVFDLAAVSSQSIAPGGATVSSPALAMGGVASYTFSATSGQRFAVNTTKTGNSLGVYDYVRVYRPNGTQFASDSFWGVSTSSTINVTADATGTWRVDLINHEGGSASWREAAGAFSLSIANL